MTDDNDCDARMEARARQMLGWVYALRDDPRHLATVKGRVNALSRKPNLSDIERVEVQLATVIIECAEGKEDAA